MATKYTSGMYEYYPRDLSQMPGTFSHHPDACRAQDNKEQEHPQDDALTTMRKLKEHVKSSLKNIKPDEYPNGQLLDFALEDVQSILDMMDTMQKVLLIHKRILTQTRA